MSSIEEEIQTIDKNFPNLSQDFQIPTFKSLGLSTNESQITYLCGNSLGLMPTQTRKAINDELDAWSQRGVESHFSHPGSETQGKTNWMDIDLPCIPKLSPIVGSLDSEIAIMGSLTSNLNALMVAFYQPQGSKTKILFEKNSFPSDYYAIFNQIKLKNLDPLENIIQLEPKEGEYHLRTQDILDTIEANHKELALIMLPGIQYYTGQFFDIEKITKFAKKFNIIVGWDLAHAVGNVPLHLHDWNVDFATWCSYKYLNSGPGGISGIFIHEIHGKIDEDNYKPRLSGWWGNNSSKRFQMLEKFEPIEGALGFRQSNPSVIDVVSLNSSLDIFNKAGGIQKLRNKSILLTNLLEKLLKSTKYYISPKDSFTLNSNELKFTIITPESPLERGAQLSLLFFPRTNVEIGEPGIMDKIFSSLRNQGVIGDERRPDVIRLAPIPLYNSAKDVQKAVDSLVKAFEELEK
ncbi:Kynureninase 1 [Wickerhamomyces ciferrii]|uniref:Kynureninase n=1 Tax=Wickerhamomyces ciferrii (strain ATCC 14091 / BCRC 22168 / CBS 111 / JCM 3599 / NBRC 0793 / NRRL Y-1031 F-60-10) TaxID=1206466 RepID=K0KKF9_WICCF|nr:Kynureninase 1 [Wickerhamomyces ciferrii]CCH41608.1 Kynureninase 1 [Wickerhamomyces ciferrii]